MTKSIDLSIMLQRTTDYVRDSSAQIKKTELMHDHALKVNHDHDEHEMQFVADLENLRKKSVLPDQEKKRQPNKQPQKKAKGLSEDLNVGLVAHQHIDIEI